MASSGKKRTTMAKLNREHKLRERRLDKQARKEARKQAAQSDGLGQAPDEPIGDSAEEVAQTGLDSGAQPPADA